MGGCASVLFLPFALCARGTDDADDQGHDPWPATGRTNESRERLQQPPVRSAEKLPLLADSGLQTVDDAVLSAILLHIAVSDDDDGFAQLLRLKAVSKRWRALVDEVAPALFMTRWQVTAVHGTPRSQRFYGTADESSFVREHPCGSLDTLSTVAVKYNSDVHSVKRANNLISDHALASRQRVFVPVRNAEDRIGRAVTIKWCPIVCREYAVLDASADATCFADFGKKAKPHDDAALAKLTNLLSRGLRIDPGQANFYLEQARGDIKEAIRLQRQDADWERSRRH